MILEAGCHEPAPDAVPVPVQSLQNWGFFTRQEIRPCAAAGKRLSKSPSFLRVPCHIWLAAWIQVRAACAAKKFLTAGGACVK